MGSQHSEQPAPLSQWEWLQNQNGVEIYRNKQDGRLAERRRIVLAGNYTLAEQNKVYAFRSNNPYGLVKSYEVVPIQDPAKQKEQIGDLCKCSNQKIQLDVFTERISHRLSELPQLTFNESLLILKQTSTAFEVAYQKVGGLHINPELIGVTDKGEVRAWVNQNWALNRPSHIIPILKSSSHKESFDNIIPQLRDETEMINNLISVISQKTEHGQFPQPFGEQLRSKATNFRAVRKFINEYVATSNINLPTIIKKDKISSIASNTNNPPSLRSASVSAFPQPQLQQPLQVPKFSFNNASYHTNTTSQLPFKQETHFTSFEYKPPQFSTQYPLSLSTYVPPVPLSERPEIKQTFSNYKPYFSDAKSEDNTFKPVFNELKFNLLPHLQSLSQQQVKPQEMPSNTLTRQESPLYSLNFSAQNDPQTTHHNATYKILQDRQKRIEA